MASALLGEAEDATRLLVFATSWDERLEQSNSTAAVYFPWSSDANERLHVRQTERVDRTFAIAEQRQRFVVAKSEVVREHPAVRGERPGVAARPSGASEGRTWYRLWEERR